MLNKVFRFLAFLLGLYLLIACLISLSSKSLNFLTLSCLIIGIYFIYYSYNGEGLNSFFRKKLAIKTISGELKVNGTVLEYMIPASCNYTVINSRKKEGKNNEPCVLLTIEFEENSLVKDRVPFDSNFVKRLSKEKFSVFQDIHSEDFDFSNLHDYEFFQFCVISDKIFNGGYKQVSIYFCMNSSSLIAYFVLVFSE